MSGETKSEALVLGRRDQCSIIRCAYIPLRETSVVAAVIGVNAKTTQNGWCYAVIGAAVERLVRGMADFEYR